MTTDAKLESIKATLRRIYELSERSIGGEQATAKAKLTALLNKYDLTLEELITDQENPVIFEWKHEWEQQLLVQVICMVKRTRTFSSWKAPKRRKAFIVKLTPTEAIDVEHFYAHYRAAYERQLADFFTAFVHRNRLFSDVPSNREEKPLTPEDIAKLKRLAQLVQSLEPSPAPRALLQEPA